MTTSNKTNKTFKLYWVYDAANHDDMFTQGYVGCTTQSIRKRFNGHKNSTHSGQANTISNTRRHMIDFIASCEDPQVMEICRTKDEDVSSKLELVLRPEPNIGANKYRGGKRNGVQKPIYCMTEDGSRLDFPSMSKAAAIGFTLGGISDTINGRGSYTSHKEHGKCVFYYA